MHSSKRPVLLIVDDDPEVLHALAFLTQARGYDVRRCGTSAEALAAATDGLHCLVIDQNLPDLPGIELLGRLRARGVAAPAVIITTAPSVALVRQAATAGASIVEKPLLDEALFARIAEATRTA
ncbi:response regulator [Brevundimonas sp.]|uniref:response regulator n=1 Tax=Brevundimonas sp. TaxID=1871086 RepID=UPI002FD96FF1